MYNFEYVRPTTLAEAASVLAGDPDAKLLAGGMSLLPAMKLRLTSVSRLADLSRIVELKGIKVAGDQLTIGAMTRHADVAASPTVMQAIPALAATAAGIGDRQVRYRGTIGGSLANNDPAADYPAAVLALGGTLKTTQRTIAADDFFQGLFKTALAEGEILTEVSFPVPDKAAYVKFIQPASRFALVGVFVCRQPSGAVRVAVTGAGPGVFRVAEIEESLAKDFTPARARLKISPEGLSSDIHGDAEYRAHLIGVLAERAVAAALQ